MLGYPLHFQCLNEMLFEPQASSFYFRSKTRGTAELSEAKIAGRRTVIALKSKIHEYKKQY